VSLRLQAAADLATIVEDAAGFGWPIKVTSPDLDTADVVGFSSDVAMTLDPGTGVMVSGRTASVAIRMAALTAAGIGIPRGIADPKSKPWTVEFTDILGNPHMFKVSESHPDRAIGLVTCSLESYK